MNGFVQAGLAMIAGIVVLAGVVVWSVRTKFSPVLDLVRRLNRRVMNPHQLRTGAGGPDKWASVVHHVGRRSGTAYRTPVVVVPDGDRFVVALVYGPTADWVANVLAAGGATIDHDGYRVGVERPEIVDRAEVRAAFAEQGQRTPDLFVRDYLRLHRIGRPHGGERSHQDLADPDARRCARSIRPAEAVASTAQPAHVHTYP